MKTKIFYIIVFLLILGILISQLHFIPSFESWENYLFVLIFSSAFIVGVIYLFKGWKQQKSKMKAILQIVLFSIIFFTTLMFSAPPMFKPEYIKNSTQNNATYYIYNESCFPPDGACECDTYGSLIYVKNKYLPIMHLVVKTNFYVGSVQLNNGELIVKASDICSKDFGKTKRILLK